MTCVHCGQGTALDDVVITLWSRRCVCLACVEHQIVALPIEMRERARAAVAALARVGREMGTGKD